MSFARIVVASIGLILVISAMWIGYLHDSMYAPLFTVIGGAVTVSTVIQKNPDRLDQIAAALGVLIATFGAWFWLMNVDGWGDLSYFWQVTIVVIAFSFLMWMMFNFIIALGKSD